MTAAAPDPEHRPPEDATRASTKTSTSAPSPDGPERAPLSPERVLRAAVALADSEGLAAVTMRRLGQALSVEAMSLYNHVANKDALLAGMVDLVVSEIALPDEALPWQAAMRQRGLAAYAVLTAHPWACGLLISRPNVGPAMLRYIDTTLGSLRRAGFTPGQADAVWNAMDSFIYGYTLQELQFPVAPADYAATATAHLSLLAGGDYPYLAELTAALLAGEHAGTHDFRFGFDLLLAGLAAALGAGESSSAARGR